MMADLTRAEFVARLLDLGRRCGEIPIYGSEEWQALDDLDPRRFASVVRAAEAWYAEGTDGAIRARLLDELAVADLLARWRVRAAGLDVPGAIDDWPRAMDVAQARAAGYEALERTERPWSADELVDTPVPFILEDPPFGRRHLRVVSS